MTRTRFHEGLDELKDRLLRMAGMAELSITRAINAFRERDGAQCRLVFASEAAINADEREIDELALDLLAMQQPMAIDLRFIVAVIKINADLERVGDQAVNIAERVERLLTVPAVDLPIDIPLMAATSAKMIRMALEAFVLGDANLAERVLTMDDTVDRMNYEIADVMMDLMKKSPEVTEQAMDAIIIARNLERVGDHATNIAEDVIFWVRGADVRHHFGGEPNR
ncbi:MAG: phosphate signaling complex protein PhoU [Acidobacteriia bacterium]|nr:phosphate signaling complex protein PhoU [Terriglobia bacterium]